MCGLESEPHYLSDEAVCNCSDRERRDRSYSCKDGRCSCGSGLSPSYRPLPGSESARFSLAQLSELELIRSAAVLPARQCAAEVLPALAQSSPSWPTFFLCASALPASNLALLLLQVLTEALLRYHCDFFATLGNITVLVRLRGVRVSRCPDDDAQCSMR